MKDLTIVTCNHYTPYLVENLVKSIKKTFNSKPNILIVNTGDRWVKYNGNQKETLPIAPNDMIEGCRHIYYGHTTHGDAVNKILEGPWVDTRYILLVDSDVLFLQDISKPFEKFKESGATLMGDVMGDRGGKSLHPRVAPWFCFMDLRIIREKKIRFYDHYRSKVLKSDKIYDIGSTMYEEVLANGLTIVDAKMEGKYFKHYEGMSWRIQKYNPHNGDADIDIGGTHDNKALYEYGLDVRTQYENDVKNL
jgi:hypothetical protein